MTGLTRPPAAKALAALALALCCVQAAPAQTDTPRQDSVRRFFNRVFSSDASNEPKKEELLPPPRTQGDGKTSPQLPRDDELFPRTVAAPPPSVPYSYDLTQMVGLMLRANPRLEQATAAIGTARGRAIQAGLYPNPVVSVTAEEVGDRTGPAGIITAPQVSQEIVTAGKLDLSRAAAEREIDQATLNLVSVRFARLGAVRQTYYEVLAIRRRVQILERLLKLADETVKTTEGLLKAKEAGQIDLVQLQVERERVRLELESARQEEAPAFRRLAAAVGVTDLPHRPLAGDLDPSVPDYDLEDARQFVSRAHPDILAGKQGVLRAQLLLQRAEVEPIPNVTVLAAYVRQNQNKSNDFNVGFSLPIPCWNKNEGNILAARAAIGEAIGAVGRTENELIERLATAYGTYAVARRRAELYRTAVLPRARDSYERTLKLYKSGAAEAFTYLRVLEAQRTYFQADLESARALGELWRAAAELSGLLLQEQWPHCPHPTDPAHAAR